MYGLHVGAAERLEDSQVWLIRSAASVAGQLVKAEALYKYSDMLGKGDSSVASRATRAALLVSTAALALFYTLLFAAAAWAPTFVESSATAYALAGLPHLMEAAVTTVFVVDAAGFLLASGWALASVPPALSMFLMLSCNTSVTAGRIARGRFTVTEELAMAALAPSALVALLVAGALHRRARFSVEKKQD